MSDLYTEIRTKLHKNNAAVIRADEFELLVKELTCKAVAESETELQNQVTEAVRLCMDKGLYEFSHPDTPSAGFCPTVTDLANWALHLRQQLEQAEARVVTVKNEWFTRGAIATLAMFDPKSTEYHEAVIQHGGYEALYAVAEDFDIDHLYTAARWHNGVRYAKDLHTNWYESAQRLRAKAEEQEKGGGDHADT